MKSTESRGSDAGRPVVIEARALGEAEGFERWSLRTARGPIEARLYPAEEPVVAGLVVVGGVGGGFDSPARGLYARLGTELAPRGISTLRVRFRDPTDLDEAVHDVCAGIELLESRGIGKIGLVGHSLGGAVVIEAAARSPEVATVIALATQAHGTERADRLSPRPLLLIHGTGDEVLPAGSSRMVYERARPPKRLHLIEGARHVLDEAADEVHREVVGWLSNELPGR